MTSAAKPQPAPAPKTTPAQAATQATQAATKAKKARKTLGEDFLANETPDARFRRVAGRRLNAAVRAIRQLKTIGQGNYEYSREQADKVLQSLVDATAEVKVAFAPSLRGSKAAQDLIQL